MPVQDIDHPSGLNARICTKTAQKSAIPERAAQTDCQSAGHGPAMAKIISIRFRRTRLPRRLLVDGWWLTSPRVRPSVVAFPKPKASGPGRKVRHLTLVHPGK
jgi:acyl dehydratase